MEQYYYHYRIESDKNHLSNINDSSEKLSRNSSISNIFITDNYYFMKFELQPKKQQTKMKL